MPQGVEHMHALAAATASVRVRIPLMPQGVEHTYCADNALPVGEDSIDAARR